MTTETEKAPRAKKKRIDPMYVAAWVAELPDNGGHWGNGVIGTIMQSNEAIADNAKAIAELELEIEKIKASTRARRKLLTETSRRAEKEVHAQYTDVQIQAARESASRSYVPAATPSDESEDDAAAA